MNLTFLSQNPRKRKVSKKKIKTRKNPITKAFRVKSGKVAKVKSYMPSEIAKVDGLISSVEKARSNISDLFKKTKNKQAQDLVGKVGKILRSQKSKLKGTANKIKKANLVAIKKQQKLGNTKFIKELSKIDNSLLIKIDKARDSLVGINNTAPSIAKDFTDLIKKADKVGQSYVATAAEVDALKQEGKSSAKSEAKLSKLNKELKTIEKSAETLEKKAKEAASNVAGSLGSNKGGSKMAKKTRKKIAKKSGKKKVAKKTAKKSGKKKAVKKVAKKAGKKKTAKKSSKKKAVKKVARKSKAKKTSKKKVVRKSAKKAGKKTARRKTKRRSKKKAVLAAPVVAKKTRKRKSKAKKASSKKKTGKRKSSKSKKAKASSGVPAVAQKAALKKMKKMKRKSTKKLAINFKSGKGGKFKKSIFTVRRNPMGGTMIKALEKQAWYKSINDISQKVLKHDAVEAAGLALGGASAGMMNTQMMSLANKLGIGAGYEKTVSRFGEGTSVGVAGLLLSGVSALLRKQKMEDMAQISDQLAKGFIGASVVKMASAITVSESSVAGVRFTQNMKGVQYTPNMKGVQYTPNMKGVKFTPDQSMGNIPLYNRVADFGAHNEVLKVGGTADFSGQTIVDGGMDNSSAADFGYGADPLLSPHGADFNQF